MSLWVEDFMRLSDKIKRKRRNCWIEWQGRCGGGWLGGGESTQTALRYGNTGFLPFFAINLEKVPPMLEAFDYVKTGFVRSEGAQNAETRRLISNNI